MAFGTSLAKKERLDRKEILFGIDLSATRLVTPSVCETGSGEFENSPDEYVGLQAAFLQVEPLGYWVHSGQSITGDGMTNGALLSGTYSKGHEPSGALRAS